MRDECYNSNAGRYSNSSYYQASRSLHSLRMVFLANNFIFGARQYFASTQTYPAANVGTTNYNILSWLDKIIISIWTLDSKILKSYTTKNIHLFVYIKGIVKADWPWPTRSRLNLEGRTWRKISLNRLRASYLMHLKKWVLTMNWFAIWTPLENLRSQRIRMR